MKTLIKRLTPKTTLNKVNLALTGVFCVMLAGMIYMKSVNAAYGNPGCPEGEWPECPEFGTAFFPHPNDCGWFFYCVDGVAYCNECIGSLHWNVELETCELPHLAGCHKDPCWLPAMAENCVWSENSSCSYFCGGKEWHHSNMRSK